MLGDSWHFRHLFGVSFDHVTAKVAALGGACKDHEECISAGGLNVYSFVYVMCFFLIRKLKCVFWIRMILFGALEQHGV